MTTLAAVLLSLAVFLAPRGAEAAENDFKVVEGVLVRPLVLPGDGIAEIWGDDRVTYYIDLRRLAQDEVRIDAQTSVTVVGYEGPRPDQISAYIVKLRNAASPVPTETRRPVDLRVFDGRVQAVSRRALTLLTNAGRTITVTLGAIGGNSRYVFLVGERLRVLGVLGDDETLMANALVQQTSATRGGGAEAEGGFGP